MKVNPYYQGSKWPVPATSFDERDPYIWKDDPRQCPPKPVMEQVAQFVYDVAAAGDAMINRQPQDYSVCKVVGQGGSDYAWAHSDRQLLGLARDARHHGHPVRRRLPVPDGRSAEPRWQVRQPRRIPRLKAALDVATLDKKTGTLSSNLTSSSPTAYPGFMPVYAAAPTHGLTASEAADYSTMIKWVSTSGQTYGDQAGQLPAGYLALTPAAARPGRRRRRARAGPGLLRIAFR